MKNMLIQVKKNKEKVEKEKNELKKKTKILMNN